MQTQTAARGGRAQGQEFFNLSGLPPELRAEVAQRLAPRSAAALVQVSRDMRASFGDAATAARLGHEAQTADLPAAERLLMDRAGIAGLPATMRTAPAAALARRLGELALQLRDVPVQARPAAFDKILRLADQIAGPASAVPLPGLAAAIPLLPEPHRHAGFAALRDRAMGMPNADRALLDVQLAKAIPALPMAHRAAAFQQVLSAAADHPDDSRREFIQALRHQLLHLPAADRLAAFRSMVDRSRGPGAQQAWEANHLVPYVAGLPIGARHEALGALALRLGALPDDDPHRLSAALPLSSVINTLPPAHRDDAARQIAYVLQALGQRLRGWLLKKSDEVVPQAVKDALRHTTSSGIHGHLDHAKTRLHA